MVELLCFSDTHGDLPPALDETHAIAWLFAGDYYNGPEIDTLDDDASDLAAREFLYPAAGWITKRSIPVCAVHGNHDILDPWNFFRQAEQIDGMVHRVADRVLVAGIGWNGEKYFEIPTESDLVSQCDSVRRQITRIGTDRDHIVLMTHYPPRLSEIFPSGEFSDPGWYGCLRKLAEEVNAIAIIQGHNHRWHGLSGTFILAGRNCLALQPGPLGMRLAIDPECGVARIV